MVNNIKSFILWRAKNNLFYSKIILKGQFLGILKQKKQVSKKETLKNNENITKNSL